MTTVVSLPRPAAPVPTTFLKPSFSIAPTQNGTLGVAVRAQPDESALQPARREPLKLPSA